MLNKLSQLFKRAPKPKPEPEPEADDLPEEEGKERVYARDEKDNQSWLGVGLDGVLAERTDAGLDGEIGPPVPDMIARVRDWVKYKRIRVKVLTPRAHNEEGAERVRQWLAAHRLGYLEFTSQKDLHMVEFWDDRAVQVISNFGIAVGPSPNNLDPGEQTDNATEDAGSEHETQ